MKHFLDVDPRMTDVVDRLKQSGFETYIVGGAIRDLLQKYGATKLSQVDPKHYEALLRDAEVLDNAT